MLNMLRNSSSNHVTFLLLFSVIEAPAIGALIINLSVTSIMQRSSIEVSSCVMYILPISIGFSFNLSLMCKLIDVSGCILHNVRKEEECELESTSAFVL